MKSKLTSTEFWFSLFAIVVGALMGAGVFGDGSIYARAGGWIVAALGSSGYSVARSLAKLGAPGATKPGYKTTEFWKALAVAAIVWAQSHLVGPGSPVGDVLGALLAMLPVGTYAIARGALKSAPPAYPSPLLDDSPRLFVGSAQAKLDGGARPAKPPLDRLVPPSTGAVAVGPPSQKIDVSVSHADDDKTPEPR